MTRPAHPTVLQLLPLPFPQLQSALEESFDVVRLWEAANRHETINQVADRVTLLLTSATTPTRADLIDQLPALRAICSQGVGFDAIDVAHAQARGIQVSNTPDVLNDCVADLAFGLLLTSARRIAQGDNYVRTNQWGSGPAFPLGSSVHHKKLGIVGLGRIGSAIAQRAAGFNMHVGYHNRTQRPDTAHTYFGTLAELAEWSDFLVVATVGGASTRHLINETILDALGPKGIIVNISRGSVIDETALVQCLQQGRLGGAALDVFDNEPTVPDALKSMENVVLLPHIASATTETRLAMANLVLENACAFAQNGKVITPIPPQ